MSLPQHLQTKHKAICAQIRYNIPMVQSQKQTANKKAPKTIFTIAPQRKIQFLSIVTGVSVATIVAFATYEIELSHIPIFPFSLCYLAIVVCALYRGFLSGSIATITSTVLIYTFVIVQLSHSPGSLAAILDTIFFLFTGLFLSFIVSHYKKIDQISEYKNQQKVLMTQIENLQGAVETATEEVRARDEFLSIASHELKTPLTSMLLQLQTALHNIRNVSLANFSVEKLMTMLSSAEQQTRRLSKMINDLLNVSLITTGRFELELQETDLSEIVHNVVNRFSERFEQQKYQVTTDAETPILGMWDKLRIEQAISNLISNAIKYGGGKPITISLKKHGNTAVLTVQDQGIGIPKEQTHRIFERFERAVAVENYKGLGVGLYITRQIVQTHGGTIHVDSKQGNGTTFTLNFPIKKNKGAKG